jgi:hypothetical protein
MDNLLDLCVKSRIVSRVLEQQLSREIYRENTLSDGKMQVIVYQVIKQALVLTTQFYSQP